jgi:hypothetical protein
MAIFPFPIIKRNPEATEVYISPDQLEAQRAEENKRHEEDLKQKSKDQKAADKRLAEEKKLEEKREKEEKKKNEEFLKEQKRLFDETLRTGILGKLDFAIRNRDKLLDNLTDTLKDSIRDRIFGKSVSDKEKELKGQIRTTIIERILTNEKYVEPKEKEEEKEESNSSEKIEHPEIHIPDMGEKSKPEDVSEKSKLETSLTPLGVNNLIAPNNSPKLEFPKSLIVEKDLSTEKKQIPVLQKISKSLDTISKTITKYFKEDSSLKKSKIKKENSEDFLNSIKVEKDDKIPDTKKEKSSFGLPLLLGIRGILGTITTTIVGILSSVSSTIAKSIPILGLATGLYMAIKDGIAGWFSADAWGVSKIAGFVGGLLGGLDKGVWGTIKNGGKWALIGAGIGSVVPVIGTLVGGLVGGAFGAILGWFGGEKIAKFIQGISDYLGEKWIAFTGKVGEMRDWVMGFVNWLTDSAKELASFSFDSMKKIFKDAVDGLYDKAKDFVKNLFSFDYWTGKKVEDKDVIDTKTMKATLPNGAEVNVPVSVYKTPDFGDKPKLDEDTKKLNDYLDKISSDQIKNKNEAIDRIYDQKVDNSVVNNTNTSSSNSDYSRTNNSVVNSNSNNTAKISIGNLPTTRNNDNSAFGTNQVINSGLGSFR